MSEEIKSSEQSNSGQTVIVNQREKNGVGTAGFVLAVIALCFVQLPVPGRILWVLGLIFSFIGVFRTPKRMAIAGLAISLIGVILLILIRTVPGVAKIFSTFF